MKTSVIIPVALLMLGSMLFAGEFPVLKGPYLGQNPPGLSPKLFAPGVVATGLYTRDFTMTPDGREIYFSIVIGKISAIVCCRWLENGWTPPEVVPGLDLPQYSHIEPHVSPDGKKFFFSSNRPAPGKSADLKDFDIWMMERGPKGWREPENLGSPVNTVKAEFFPSITAGGVLYYTAKAVDDDHEYIFRSPFKEGRFSAPEKLPDRINAGKARFNAFVAPDESYLIVPIYGLPDSRGETDYYVVFRNADGSWREPVNLGDAVNTPGGEEYSGSVSPDGKYFFFMSARGPDKENVPARLTYGYLQMLHNSAANGNSSIYWIDSSVIFRLRSGNRLESGKKERRSHS